MSTDRNCHRTLLALPWLLNGSLEAEERRQVREHLIGCPACRAELQRTREALAVFESARHAAAAEPVAAEATRVVALSSWRRGAAGLLRPGLLRPRASWAAVAALVVAAVGVAWLGTTLGSEPGRGVAPTAHVAPVLPPQRTVVPATPPEPEVIYSTSFEQGSVSLPQAVERPRISARLARPAPSRALVSSKISTISFENGELGELR